MSGLWPQENEVPGFKAAMLDFERRNWELSGTGLPSCFAFKLGFDGDFFARAHDPSSPGYQSTLRIIHYLGMEDAKPEDFTLWRAGAHSDFDCLTLLHQRKGQGGLQVCPGKDADTLQWTSVEPLQGYVTCNIGDMLMRWSDDRLQSTLLTGCVCRALTNTSGRDCQFLFSARPTKRQSLLARSANMSQLRRTLIYSSASRRITRGRRGGKAK